MLEFIISLPFSIEVWKTISILLLGAVFFLVKIYNKYFKLQDVMEIDIKELKETSKQLKLHMEKIEEQHQEFLRVVDKFIGVVTTTDDISIKQKEQIELLNKIVDNFKVQDVCRIKDSIKEGTEALNLKKLLDMICDEYELHKKD